MKALTVILPALRSSSALSSGETRKHMGEKSDFFFSDIHHNFLGIGMKDSAAHPQTWAAAQTKKPDYFDPALQMKLKIDIRLRIQAQAKLQSLIVTAPANSESKEHDLQGRYSIEPVYRKAHGKSPQIKQIPNLMKNSCYSDFVLQYAGFLGLMFFPTGEPIGLHAEHHDAAKKWRNTLANDSSEPSERLRRIIVHRCSIAG
ncbi:MAG: hypothetical protein KF908_15320 [Nitrosomonas sp.]|nr:hypothetical protein [Nitrosomonas sp.]MCW5608888.1 hypothetical protein [Nitrosomonas sp.]